MPTFQELFGDPHARRLAACPAPCPSLGHLEIILHLAGLLGPELPLSGNWVISQVADLWFHSTQPRSQAEHLPHSLWYLHWSCFSCSLVSSSPCSLPLSASTSLLPGPWQTLTHSIPGPACLKPASSQDMESAWRKSPAPYGRLSQAASGLQSPQRPGAWASLIHAFAAA